MTTAPHLVVIASVSWRLENLVKLLRCITEQTRRPEFLLIILDGYSRLDEAEFDRVVTHSITFPGMASMAVTNRPRRGPGDRWVRATRMLATGDVPPDTIVSSIDDDFLIEPTYLETSYNLVANAHVPTAIGWLGETPDFIRWSSPQQTETKCISLGAGLLTCRLRDLAGIAEFPEAARYFTPPGDDEALVSYWLWKNDVRLIRPAGVAAAKSVDALQYDDRASFIGMGEHRHCVLRMNLKKNHGWSTYRLPWEFAGRDELVDGVGVNPAGMRSRAPR